jgi:hypothetical protein
MSVQIFSCLCVSVFSFLGIPNFLSAIKYLSFCHVIFVYLYHITQTTKNPDWHELRCSIWVYSSNFTNTTSWVKELGAIALPTFKNWGMEHLSSCQIGFLVVCASQSSVFWVFLIFCQPLNICLFVMLYLYTYIRGIVLPPFWH